MKEITVLNLGAGVQSTALYLMLLKGEITPQIDYAIFADVQEEPKAVYTHLEWLKSLGGPPILIGTAGKLGDDLMKGRKGRNSTVQRFASIPAFTKDPKGKVGKLRRQCTREYKTDVVERIIRREIVGLIPRQRMPKDVKVLQYIGISIDEAGRALRIRKRFEEGVPWASVRFPLLEKTMTRAECVMWLRNFGVPHEVPRSACVFCPYHDNVEWKRLRDEDPESWQRAVAVDHSLRIPGNIVNRGMDQPIFLHRACVPLDQVNLDNKADKVEQTGFREECEGMCGN